jgi:hypothetical protein
MGLPPSPDMTVERIDNNNGYSPDNCRWATRAEQNENTRMAKLITHEGLTLSIGKWSKRLGISRKTLRKRLFKENLPPSEAFNPLRNASKVRKAIR